MQDLSRKLDSENVKLLNDNQYVDWGEPLTAKKAAGHAHKKKNKTMEEEALDKMRAQMMQNVKEKDPLIHIYQDIADRYDPNEFKNPNYDSEMNEYRHQRFKITGFNVLIPVKESWAPADDKDYSIYKHQFTRLAWTSELVCHSRNHVAKVDLGDYL